MLCLKNIKYRPASSDCPRRRAARSSTMLEAPAGLVADVSINSKTGGDGAPVATGGTASAAESRKTHRSSTFSARGFIADTLPKVASYLTIMITWLIFRFLLRGLNKVRDEADVHPIVMTGPARSRSFFVALVYSRQPGQAGCKCVRLRRHLLLIVGAVKMMNSRVRLVVVPRTSSSSK